jgi:putative ABC transport system ATP-binding protein
MGDVKFHDVTFRYVDSMPPVADGVNLHIRRGETIALIGPSGGGKTTLAKLLLRLYHPQRGIVLNTSRMWSFAEIPYTCLYL